MCVYVIRPSARRACAFNCRRHDSIVPLSAYAENRKRKPIINHALPPSVAAAASAAAGSLAANVSQICM